MSEPTPPELDSPLFNRKNLGIGLVALAALWLTAAMTKSAWVLGIMGVLTLAAAGGLIWVYRLVKKQRAMVTLLQSAQGSPEARKAALAQLQGDDKDVLKMVARAQLEAQDDPKKAIATLEMLDLSKVPSTSQDDVRVLRAQLYLASGRLRDAANMADGINLGAAPNAQAKAMVTAIVGEAWARTGKADRALVILDDLKLDDAEMGQAAILARMAKVFAAFHAGKKDRAKKELEGLMKLDVNYLGRFVMPGGAIHLELQQLAKQVAMNHPDVRKQQKQAQRGSFGRVR
jgi:hypothetical protein